MPEPGLDGYLAPARSGRAELRDRGSRFLGIVEPVAGGDEAKRALEAIRREFPNATHHCWAWRLGAEGAERCSDDGEPSGTAGQPILRVLRGAEISDALAVVVRWYGGVKLGKGGLARAYSGATRLVLDDLPSVARVPKDRLRLGIPYELVGAVKRLVHPPVVELVEETYGERARLVLEVERRRRGEVDRSLADLGIQVET